MLDPLPKAEQCQLCRLALYDAGNLVEKDLWDVVDGSLTHLIGSPNHKAVKTFVKKQQLAHAKIILSIKASTPTSAHSSQ